ncbi:MAG: hypothetical protein LUQ66_05935 [Methanoregula sp.]|nr:hypothetical protein [Methanoregula sp.]
MSIKIVILVFVFLVLVGTVTVSAISVSGAKYMGSIAPGSSDEHKITVGIKANEDPTDVIVEVKGFGQALNKGYTSLELADDKSAYSARTFITLDNTTIHLEPGTTKTIKATIKLPQNIGPGGRYAIIYVSAIPGVGKSFTTAVQVPVFITVSGTSQTETGSITGLDIGEVNVGQPIVVTTSLKNTGNYHYYHTTNAVILTDSNGNVVANMTTSPSIDAIIPESTVQFVTKPEVKDLPAGTYTVNSKVLLENGQLLDEKSATFDVKTAYIPPVTESSITITPGSAGTLATPDGRYSVSFPQGSIVGDAVVTLKSYSKDKLPAAPTNAKLGTTYFEITGLTGLLSKDATVKVPYSADDLAVAGGDASQLKLAYFDTAQNAWVILPTQVDSQGMTLTTTTNHLSVWAVMVSSSTTGGTAAVAAPGATATESPMPLTIVLASVIIAVIAMGSTARKRK